MRISCLVNLVCRHRSSRATGRACWNADGLFSCSSSSISVASSMIGLSGGVAIARWPPNRSPSYPLCPFVADAAAAVTTVVVTAVVTAVVTTVVVTVSSAGVVAVAGVVVVAVSVVVVVVVDVVVVVAVAVELLSLPPLLLVPSRPLLPLPLPPPSHAIGTRTRCPAVHYPGAPVIPGRHCTRRGRRGRPVRAATGAATAQ